MRATAVGNYHVKSDEPQAFHADVDGVVGNLLSPEIGARHSTLDVLINNAGVFKVPVPLTEDGFNIRFIVNTVAPYLLAKRLLPLLPSHGRIINLSSAVQTPVSLDALAGKVRLDDNQAYGQSKLGLTMWSFHLAQSLAESGPAVIAVNPGSFRASKMVRTHMALKGTISRLVQASLLAPP